MAERLLYVPPDFASPATCHAVRGIRALLDNPRAHFDVDIFTWPCVKGATDAQPDVDGCVQSLRRQIQPPCHTLSAASATPVTLLALDGLADEASCYVANDIGLPDATLQSLGLFTFADAGTAAVQLETGGALLRLITADLGPTAVAQVASDVDLDRLAEYIDSVESLDLTKVRPASRYELCFLNRLASWRPIPRASLARFSRLWCPRPPSDRCPTGHVRGTKTPMEGARWPRS